MIECEWTTGVGYPAVVLRHPELGHRCGYVGVPMYHPLAQMPVAKVEDVIEVHGGVTYSDNAHPAGHPDGYWYFGFDTAHAWDYVPGLEEFIRAAARTEGRPPPKGLGGVVRDLQFCVYQCEKMARQLGAWAGRAADEQ